MRSIFFVFVKVNSCPYQQRQQPVLAYVKKKTGITSTKTKPISQMAYEKINKTAHGIWLTISVPMKSYELLFYMARQISLTSIFI